MRIISSQKIKPDYIFLFTAIALMLIGIVMISSSSMVTSFEMFGTNYHYVIRQIGFFVLGGILLISASMIDYRIWRKLSTILFFITIILLLGVFLPILGHKIGGSHRWFGIGSAVFQPSEIVKLTFIIYLAAWLEKKGDTIKSFMTGFLPFAILIGLVSFLIIKEPDMGTMSVIAATSAAMFFISGADLIHLAFGGASLVVLIYLMIKAAPYRMQRYLVFLNPTSDSQGAAYHINQALIAIGTGGLWGLGFGQSRQKYLYLPMAHTDSIFAIICEELGFVRSSIIIILFLFLGYRGYRIAKYAPDQFSRLLAVGITTWILVQAFVNIGAMLNVLPMTGVPLPFISYGGSSLIILMIAIGIMINISKNGTKETV